jgi:hypothetical protein
VQCTLHSRCRLALERRELQYGNMFDPSVVPVWQLVVTLVGALATFTAATVALFGDWIRSKFVVMRPRLELTLSNELGTAAKVAMNPNTPDQRIEDCRIFHAAVVNHHRWVPAKGVRVYVIRVEEKDAAGGYRATWASPIPVQWEHPETSGLERTVGEPWNCDLCTVIKGKWVSLHPVVVPIALVPLYRDACHIRVTLQVRSVETESAPLVVTIDWDGGWADGAQEM